MFTRGRSLLRDMLAIALVFGCAYFLFYEVHVERRWKRVMISSTLELKRTEPEIKTIWFAGMLKGNGVDNSWVNALPKLFSSRFPKARIFIVLQQRPETRGAKFDLNTPLKIAELKRASNLSSNEWTFEPVDSIQDVKCLKPDVIFLRNAYNIVERIAHQAPWLVDPSVVRIIYPVHNYRGLELADIVVSSDSFLKPLPSWQVKLTEEAIKKRPTIHDKSGSPNQFPFVKDDVIFFPASLYEKKGQLNVAKLLDPKLFRKYNLTLVFAGKMYNESYWVEVQRVLIEKGIRFNYLGFIKDRREMFDWYARSRGLIHYASDGPGPRVVYEALYANTPFLVSPNVTLDARILPFGVRVGGGDSSLSDAEEFNKKFEELLTTRWSDRLLLFARRHLTDSAFDSLFDRIECLLTTKKRDNTPA